MRVIIGYGNTLRGEDAFGVDVVKKLENFKLHETKLLTAFGLTPELVLELLEADEIVFVDACYSNSNHYILACNIFMQQTPQFSHHITPEVLIEMLRSLYNKKINYIIYSMLSNNFEEIQNAELYKESINAVVQELINERS
jgi:hydrogenase maturation protease